MSLIPTTTKQRTLGVNFSKYVLAKNTAMQRINTPSIVNPSRPIWQVDKVIAEDMNWVGEFRNSAPIIT